MVGPLSEDVIGIEDETSRVEGHEALIEMHLRQNEVGA